MEPRSKEPRISLPHVDRRRPSSVFTSTSTPSSAHFPVYNQLKFHAIAVYIRYFCYSISSPILRPFIWLREHRKPPSQQPMKCHRKSYGNKSDRYFLSKELPSEKYRKTDILNYSCLQLGSMASSPAPRSKP